MVPHVAWHHLASLIFLKYAFPAEMKRKSSSFQVLHAKCKPFQSEREKKENPNNIIVSVVENSKYKVKKPEFIKEMTDSLSRTIKGKYLGAKNRIYFNIIFI